MSIPLTISRLGLKLSRHRAANDGSELENGRPDIASLEDFASKVRFFQRRPRKAPETPGTQGRTVNGDATPGVTDGEAAHLEEVVTPASSLPLDRPLGGSSALRPIKSTPHTPPSQPAGITLLLANVDLYTEDTGTATTVATSMTGAESVHTDLTKPDSAQGDDVGECSSAQQNTNHDQTKPVLPVMQNAIQMPTPAIELSSISSKGKETVRSSRGKPTKIYIPRGKLDILRKIRIASPQAIKIEDAVFSAVHREKLRKFLSVLGSKKDQIELFGKELPLCRAYLVQVIEGMADPAPYICIQGLRNADDITRFHSVMSHKRYRALYDPLRLGYDNSDVAHIGNSESPGTSQAPSYSKSRVGSGPTREILSPIPEIPLYTYMETFYEYLPVANNRTYCGALSRTFDNGKICLSTFGGLVEVDGKACLMSCQHGFYEPSVSAVLPLSDVLAESDVPSEVEGPLVFCSGGLYDAPSDRAQADQSNLETRLASLGTFGELGWRNLSVGGAIRKGREWCLVPIEGHSILPNFVERPSSNKGKSTNEPEIFYLDQIAEPQPGHATYISCVGCSGVISRNTSFFFGSGTEGVLEAWKVLIDEEKGPRKGDSGSWVLDTSDPLQYKVIGSAIAISDGAVHFVRIRDQFFDMIGNAVDGTRVSLAPVFQCLVQCAHTASRWEDFHQADWFIEQALSRRALEQMHNGWYLPTIKAILGIIDDDGNIVSRENPFPWPVVESLSSLLLRYGAEILDAAILRSEWLDKHNWELQSGEKQVLLKLVAAAKCLNQEKSKQPDNLLETLPQHSSEPIKDPQAAPKERKRVRVRSWPDDGKAFGFLVKTKDVIPPIYLLFVLSILLFASVSGIAAATVLRDIEKGNRDSFFHINTAKAVSVGAASGVISVIPMAIHVLLIYIFSSFDWYLYLGQNVFSSSVSHRINRGIAESVVVGAACKGLLIIASSLARSTLTALYLARSLDVDNTYALITASAAAAVPLTVSSASPILFWVAALTLELETELVPNFIARVGVGVMLTTAGFDALAGYTFGRVAQNQGLDVIRPQSGAASFGVFGALIIFWSFLSYIALWAAHLRMKRFARPRPYVDERRDFIRSWLTSTNPEAHATRTEETLTVEPRSRSFIFEMAPTLGSSAKAPTPSTWTGSTSYRPTPTSGNYSRPASSASYDGSTAYTRNTSQSTAYTRKTSQSTVYDGRTGYFDDALHRFSIPRDATELPTEPPTHQPPEIPKPKITPEPLPSDPSFRGFAEWLRSEPNYYVTWPQGQGYPSAHSV
ncbi:hypothetical protein GGR51DRAFT_559814 [Nemania sp. FL0031]|nr:hypothetical protein GGR51DRAFT_559814 [Nemania sp. FL0031]